MSIFNGFSISPGFASGVASIYDYEIERRLELPHRDIDHSEVELERDRLTAALEKSSAELRLATQSALDMPRLAESASVLSAHSSMATEIAALVRQQIGDEFVNVEQALDTVIGEWLIRLQRLDSSRLCQREQDIRDVGQRIMRNLTGAAPWSESPVPAGSVIVARELLPSDAIELAHFGVVAIVTERGGLYSHTAIVAQSLGIAAVSGIPDVTRQISPGMRVLVDGESGTATIAPSPANEEDFALRKRHYERFTAPRTNDERLPCATRDDIEISLVANIGQPEEVEQIAQHSLNGIGLFRTEFLFLESSERPDYDTQLDLYQSVANGLDGLPLVIRTFDLGGDKMPAFLLEDRSDTHSSLHLRGLRFSLAEGYLLETQLRAILQTAGTADVRILFPMVVGSHDFARAIEAVQRVADQLGLLRIPPIGAMLETPAALYALDEIFDLADFAAIGTNDLTQYMLAADRDLAEGSDECTATHPAVLRAIKQIAETAKLRGCPLCVCGEEAGDPKFACLLIGLGIEVLSLSPARARDVRRAIRQISRSQAEKVAEAALRCRSPHAVRKLLEKLEPVKPTPSPCGSIDE